MPFAAPPTRTSMFQWVPTDQQQLIDAEARMLKPIAGHYTQTMVQTPHCPINTIYSTAPHHKETVLLLHGFGFGLAQWVPNWQTLCQHANVYAIDMPGFARSGRAAFSGGGEEAVLYFIQMIEEWIKAVWSHESAPKLVLIGHSFGGFIAVKFAMNYPQRVKQLILVDPFGVNEGVPQEVVVARNDLRSKAEKFRNWAVEKLFYKVSPMCPLRGLGPLGPKLVAPKMDKKNRQWSGHVEDGAVVDYLYHCNAQSPSGEQAFTKCITGMGAGFGDGFVAKFPLCHELPKLPADIPLHFIYGSHTWIPHVGGYQTVRMRNERYDELLAAAVMERSDAESKRAAEGPESTVEVPELPQQPISTINIVPRAGHHVYVENASRFNGVLLELVVPSSRRKRSRGTSGNADGEASPSPLPEVTDGLLAAASSFEESSPAVPEMDPLSPADAIPLNTQMAVRTVHTMEHMHH